MLFRKRVRLRSRRCASVHARTREPASPSVCHRRDEGTHLCECRGVIIDAISEVGFLRSAPSQRRPIKAIRRRSGSRAALRACGVGEQRIQTCSTLPLHLLILLILLFLQFCFTCRQQAAREISVRVNYEMVQLMFINLLFLPYLLWNIHLHELITLMIIAFIRFVNTQQRIVRSAC